MPTLPEHIGGWTAAGFPPGQYRIEIWRTGKMIYSERFEIKSD